jgi:hypothetical protein
MTPIDISVAVALFKIALALAAALLGGYIFEHAAICAANRQERTHTNDHHHR